METILKKYLYVHRNDTYCIIINNDIKDIFTLKAVLIKDFLVKGKSDIFKYLLNRFPPSGAARVGGGAGVRAPCTPLVACNNLQFTDRAHAIDNYQISGLH